MRVRACVILVGVNASYSIIHFIKTGNFYHRSLQKLEQWDKIVKKINELVIAFQTDTGALCK